MDAGAKPEAELDDEIEAVPAKRVDSSTSTSDDAKLARDISYINKSAEEARKEIIENRNVGARAREDIGIDIIKMVGGIASLGALRLKMVLVIAGIMALAIVPPVMFDAKRPVAKQAWQRETFASSSITTMDEYEEDDSSSLMRDLDMVKRSFASAGQDVDGNEPSMVLSAVKFAGAALVLGVVLVNRFDGLGLDLCDPLAPFCTSENLVAVTWLSYVGWQTVTEWCDEVMRDVA